MVIFFAKFFLFIFLTAMSAIIAARKLWSFINGRIDAEALHLAADVIGPYLGFNTHGDKTQQHNVIQMVINWVSMPIGISVGFAVLFVLEVVLRRVQDDNKN